MQQVRNHYYTLLLVFRESSLAQFAIIFSLPGSATSFRPSWIFLGPSGDSTTILFPKSPLWSHDIIPLHHYTIAETQPDLFVSSKCLKYLHTQSIPALCCKYPWQLSFFKDKHACHRACEQRWRTPCLHIGLVSRANRWHRYNSLCRQDNYRQIAHRDNSPVDLAMMTPLCRRIELTTCHPPKRPDG